MPRRLKNQRIRKLQMATSNHCYLTQTLRGQLCGLIILRTGPFLCKTYPFAGDLLQSSHGLPPTPRRYYRFWFSSMNHKAYHFTAEIQSAWIYFNLIIPPPYIYPSSVAPATIFFNDELRFRLIHFWEVRNTAKAVAS